MKVEKKTIVIVSLLFCIIFQGNTQEIAKENSGKSELTIIQQKIKDLQNEERELRKERTKISEAKSNHIYNADKETKHRKFAQLAELRKAGDKLNIEIQELKREELRLSAKNALESLESEQSKILLENLKAMANKDRDEARVYIGYIVAVDEKFGPDWKQQGILLNDTLLPRFEIDALRRYIADFETDNVIRRHEKEDLSAKIKMEIDNLYEEERKNSAHGKTSNEIRKKIEELKKEELNIRENYELSLLKSKQSQSALEKIKELADKNISEAFEYVYSIKVADMNWKREGIILNDKLLPREEVYALQKLVSIIDTKQGHKTVIRMHDNETQK